jgi:hypothetical protein
MKLLNFRLRLLHGALPHLLEAFDSSGILIHAHLCLKKLVCDLGIVFGCGEHRWFEMRFAWGGHCAAQVRRAREEGRVGGWLSEGERMEESAAYML